MACSEINEYIPVRVDVIKAQGETFNLYTLTDMTCSFNTETVSFKFYREHTIEIKAYSEQVPGGFFQIRGEDYLSWDEVYPKYDFGDTYNYTSNVLVKWVQN